MIFFWFDLCSTIYHTQESLFVWIHFLNRSFKWWMKVFPWKMFVKLFRHTRFWYVLFYCIMALKWTLEELIDSFNLLLLVELLPETKINTLGIRSIQYTQHSSSTPVFSFSRQVCNSRKLCDHCCQTSLFSYKVTLWQQWLHN